MMKSFYFSVFFLFFLFFLTGNLYPQVYQLSNPGFELWDGNGTNDEPTNWNGFPSASCNLVVGCGSATVARHEKSTDIRPGSTGSYSCKLFATSTLGIIANGTITTGQIRIGSTTPTNSQNYNITRANNSTFRQPLNAKPDSIGFWAKFICPSSAQQARMSATIHDHYDYRDPEASDPNAGSHVVGKAIHNFVRGNQGWNYYKIPFDYNYPAITPAFILLTFTTNKNAGEGSPSDVLYIDDIELIYNPRLSNLSVNGIQVPGFHPQITDYYVNVPCFSSQTVQAVAASPNASVQIIQPAYASPSSQITVTAGNVTMQYQVHFSYVTVTDIYAEVCMGDSYSDIWFNLPPQMNAGTFVHQSTIYAAPGCDSIMRLSLIVHPSYFPDTINAMICYDGSYDFYGNILTQAGIYDTIISTIHGCDSLVVLNLEVGDHYLFNIIASICEGEIYDQNGFYQNQPGLDTIVYQAADGCDSLIVLNLTVNPLYDVFITDTVFVDEAYNHNGFNIPPQPFDGEFNFTQYHTSVAGCDSTVTLQLIILLPEDEYEEDDPEFAMSIFPNPASDYIEIELVTTSSSVFIYNLYDARGKLRRAGIIEDKSVMIYLYGLSPGVYLIRVHNNAGSSQGLKFVKQ
jgi:hypothetical protein